MPRKDRPKEALDASTEAMLAEHERLSALYLNNADMGEKRTTTYLTLVSAGGAVILGAAQFRMEPQSLLWLSLGLLAGMIVLGLLTYQRLIERRVRATEYLRAINRIHCFFVWHDPALRPYFYWPPCDNVPSFRGKGAGLAGLRDVIAALNSLFVGILVVIIELQLWPALHNAIAIVSGLAIGALSWHLHQVYEDRSLDRAERSALKHVLFPDNGAPADPSASVRATLDAPERSE